MIRLLESSNIPLMSKNEQILRFTGILGTFLLAGACAAVQNRPHHSYRSTKSL